MAVFRKINTSFWQDPLVLDLTPEEKYFYLYLMTNTKTNQCGIYEIPKKVMEMETGYNGETIDKLINRFVEYKRILFSKDTNEIMLLNWIKYNGSASPKVLSRVETELKEIKNKEMVEHYINLSNGLNYKLDTVSILYPYSTDIQSQEEEEEEEEEEGEEVGDEEIKISSKDITFIIEEWNNLKLQQLRTLNSTTERYKSLKARINDYSFNEVIEAIRNINNSNFLKGHNDRGWTITFDWLVKPNNFPKVLEGNYTDKEGEHGKGTASHHGTNEGNDIAKRAGVTSL